MLLQVLSLNGTTVIQETNHENTPRLENTMDFNKRGPRIIQKQRTATMRTCSKTPPQMAGLRQLPGQRSFFCLSRASTSTPRDRGPSSPRGARRNALCRRQPLYPSPPRAIEPARQEAQTDRRPGGAGTIRRRVHCEPQKALIAASSEYLL